MAERFTSRPEGGTKVVLPSGTTGVVLKPALQVTDPQRVRVAWEDGMVTVVRYEQLAPPRDIRAELVMLLRNAWNGHEIDEQADAILAAGWRPRA